MKSLRFILVALILSLSLGFSQPADAARIVVNNQPLTGLSQEPVIIDGRTFVPLRGVFEVFGTVHWNPANYSVEIRTPTTGIFLVTGSDYAVVTNYQGGVAVASNVVYMDRPSWIANGRVMLPVRFIAETLNAQVEWLQSSQTVYIDFR